MTQPETVEFVLDGSIAGQPVSANDLGYIITEDARSLYKFCQELKAKNLISARAIKLEDGFNKSHFDPAGQHDFDTNLGETGVS